MSADEGSEYDDDHQDQEEVLLDQELDGQDGRMDLEEDGPGADLPRMKINQVQIELPRKWETTPAQPILSMERTTL